MAAEPPGRTPEQGPTVINAASRRPRPAGPEFVWINTYQAPAGRDAGPHRYAMWKLTLYRQGSIDTMVGSKRFHVERGSLLVIPPSIDHSEQARTAYSSVYLLATAPATWPWPELTTDHDGTLANLFDRLYREHWAPDTHSAAMISALLTEVDITLRRAAGGQSTTAAQLVVRTAERIFMERYSRQIRIDQIARELELSESTLRAYFQAELGVSPRERLRHIRLQHAISLLRTSNLTVESVAARCGYHSASHLSRHLKQSHGLAPSEIRRV